MTHVLNATHSDGQPLLERTAFVAQLRECLGDVIAGRGRLALVSGEAGVGKTVLARRFCEVRDEARVLWGDCDALFTPPPLGPLLDVAATTGGELADVVEAGDSPTRCRGARWRSSRRETDDRRARGCPLGRRGDARRPASSRPPGRDRPGAGGRDLPRRRARPCATRCGSCSASSRGRRASGGCSCPPLSAAAVAELAAPHGVDAAELHRRTAGNPFFVTEALAAGGVEMPATVRDAVLARAARAERAERDGARGGGDRAAAHRALAARGARRRRASRISTSASTSRRARAAGDGVAFRHELARRGDRGDARARTSALALHRARPRALAESAGAGSDLARLAYHAEAPATSTPCCGSRPPRPCARPPLGAHREAAAQYARALRFADRPRAAERADLLERRSYECYVTDQLDEAIEALDLASECHRELGDQARGGRRSLRSALELIWCPVGSATAEQAGRSGRRRCWRRCRPDASWASRTRTWRRCDECR